MPETISFIRLQSAAKELNQKIQFNNPIKYASAKKDVLLKDLIEASELVQLKDNISKKTLNILKNIGGKSITKPEIKQRKANRDIYNPETKMGRLCAEINKLVKNKDKFTIKELKERSKDGDNPQKHDTWYVSMALDIIEACEILIECKDGTFQLK